jgi:hypothetical protein
VTVRELSPDDADWAADLMADRRREYERYSPVFWRPAAHARALHVRFLRRQLTSPDTVALRTTSGFLIAQLRPGEAFVDDFAIIPGATWTDAGAELLLAVWDRVSAHGVAALRVVTAQADRAKSALLAGLGLDLTEQWWVRELAAPANPAAADSAPPYRRFEPPQRIDGPGFSALFGPAPPVYDPGGPVLLVDRLADDADVAELEAKAIQLGAVLLVVAAVPGTAQALELSGGGGHVASDWYAGRPAWNGS